jgi:hypothetical protein
MRERGYDPDAEEDIENQRQHQIILKLIERSAAVGNGSIHSKGHWIREILLTVVIALSAWTLKTEIQNSSDIAVIKCQLSPECREVMDRVKH